MTTRAILGPLTWTRVRADRADAWIADLVHVAIVLLVGLFACGALAGYRYAVVVVALIVLPGGTRVTITPTAIHLARFVGPLVMRRRSLPPGSFGFDEDEDTWGMHFQSEPLREVLDLQMPTPYLRGHEVTDWLNEHARRLQAWGKLSAVECVQAQLADHARRLAEVEQRLADLGDVPPATRSELEKRRQGLADAVRHDEAAIERLRKAERDGILDASAIARDTSVQVDEP